MKAAIKIGKCSAGNFHMARSRERVRLSINGDRQAMNDSHGDDIDAPARGRWRLARAARGVPK